MKKITILGSTGSIGVQALELVSENPKGFEVNALVAGGSNMDLLFKQVHDCRYNFLNKRNFWVIGVEWVVGGQIKVKIGEGD